MEDIELSAALECLLFASGEPAPLERLAEALEEAPGRILQVLREMGERTAGGLQVVEVAGGWMLGTRPEFAACIARLLRVHPHRLSRAALETLAIIAYRQPITTPEVEAIRGVSTDAVMGTLEARGLIRETGRKQAPGRPILYETTEEFLRYLGIRSLGELPQLDT